MSANEGRQSPPLEDQKGSQGKEPPSNAHGVNDSSNNQKESKSQLEGFSSNPTGPLDDHAKEATSKTVNPIPSEK